MIDVKRLLKRKKLMIITVILIIVILFAFKVLAEEKPAQTMQVNTLTVEVEKAELTDALSGLTYKADLEPAEEAVITSNVSGQVTQVLFENGDKVTQGQTLAYLDDKDLQNQLRTAKIDLNKLQLELSSKQNDYNTTKALYENGACARSAYDAAELAYQTALSNVELKQVGIQDINNSLSNCVIKAPLSGEIGDKSVSLGQYVSPGTTFGKIKNNTSIRAVIQLMQDDLEKVSEGQTVTFKLNEKDEESYQGVVKTIATSADSQTRVFNCLISIDNASGILNSGVTGYIEIPDQNKKQVLTVPMTAVSGSEGDYSVFTIKDKKARKVSVTIGEMSDDMAEITSGLQEGDPIIVSNLNSLQDGDKVEVSGEGK